MSASGLPGFPFLRHESPATETRTALPCPICGQELMIEESIWVNEYTGERFIVCERCCCPVGQENSD